MLTMTHNLLRKGQALLFACLLLGACSKSASLDEMSAARAAQQKARLGDDPKTLFPPGPMPVDTIELQQADNPQDL
jgi:hypothetical protein